MSSAVFEHVEQKCNLEPIKELLREIKNRSDKASREIQIGINKQESVQNLRRAVEANYVSIEKVFEMLRSAEETGHQHILLLCPAPKLGDPPSLDPKSVTSAIFDDFSEWNFPRFEYPSSGYAWADFRYNPEMNEDWTAKMYGREVTKVSVGPLKTEDLGDGKITESREYEYQERKTVLVTKWNSDPQILEVRVDVSGLQTPQTLEDRRAEMWRLFERAISPKQFVGVNVEGLLNNLVFERKTAENQSRYSITKIELTDPRSGLIRVVPFKSEDLDKDPGREKTLDVMKAADFTPWSVKIDWKPEAEGVPPSMKDPIATVLEKTQNGPELRIMKKVPSEVYEYVFGQIRTRLGALS